MINDINGNVHQKKQIVQVFLHRLKHDRTNPHFAEISFQSLLEFTPLRQQKKKCIYFKFDLGIKNLMSSGHERVNQNHFSALFPHAKR